MPEQKPKGQAHLSSVEQPRSKSQPKYLQIANLKQFQHYTKRNPPWVKLHAYWLEHYEFQLLPDHTKYHFLMLMLLASRVGNKIPNDPNWVAARIGAQEPVNLAALLRIGVLEPLSPGQPGARQKAVDKAQIPLPDASNLLAQRSQDASNTLADCKQVASPETETEAETEAEHTHTGPARDARAEGALAEVCVVELDYGDYLSFVLDLNITGKGWKGEPIRNPGGLARHLQEKGYADEAVRRHKLSLKEPSQPLSPPMAEEEIIRLQDEFEQAQKELNQKESDPADEEKL